VLHKRAAVAVIGLGSGLVEVAEGVAEEVDGVSLEAEADVGVDRGGDADVGVAEAARCGGVRGYGAW
jgi:hypothetical protein